MARPEEPEVVWLYPVRPVRRDLRLQRARKARIKKNNHRDTSHFRQFKPGGRSLSRTQFLERCTKLSHMGRFQIYDWLYYRWEFWRYHAIKLRCRSTRPAASAVIGLRSFGLSDAHLWPG